jgi:hypothetical protein
LESTLWKLYTDTPIQHAPRPLVQVNPIEAVGEFDHRWDDVARGLGV